jgi:hypothetical protein
MIANQPFSTAILDVVRSARECRARRQTLRRRSTASRLSRGSIRSIPGRRHRVLRATVGYVDRMKTYLLVAGAAATTGAVLGFMTGRWWSFLIAVLVPPLAFVPAGNDSDGAAHWFWALILIVPPALIGTAIGVIARIRRGGSSTGRTART